MSPIYPLPNASKSQDSRHIFVIGEHGSWLPEIGALLQESNYHLCICESIEQLIEYCVQSNLLAKTIILDEQFLQYKYVKQLQAATQNQHGETNLILALHEDDHATIHCALELGVFFFIMQRFSSQMALKVIESAIDTELALSSQLTTLDPKHQLPSLVNEASFSIRTPSEAKTIANILGYLAPSANRVSVGLFELLLNAIEHGNLGIGFEQKAKLLAGDYLQTYIETQLSLPENTHKEVRITFTRRANELVYTIEDQGNGFDPQKYLEFDSKRALEKNGRGILIAIRHSFDSLHYENCGRRVVASVTL